MEVYISAIGVLKVLHNLRLEGWVGQEIVGTPYLRRILTDLSIAFSIHADIHSHIVGALVNTADYIFSAAKTACQSNGISNRYAQIRRHKFRQHHLV